HTTDWLHVTQITVKNPPSQSFQLLNNTKQTVTYFREQGTSEREEPEWSPAGGGPGGGAEAEQEAEQQEAGGRPSFESLLSAHFVSLLHSCILPFAPSAAAERRGAAAQM
uniref:Uncharacterized protein n=1 Tax=Gasterosteus aculeatus TaxID=69293 RepID=G3PN63_GASAC